MDSIERRVREVNSLICVGLDPRLGENGVTDAPSALRSCLHIVSETQHLAACYKPNCAFFESLPGGTEALKELIAQIPKEIPVILDCKRGDIFETAVAYAQWASMMGAHIVTLSGYMGSDSLKPFVERGIACFVLCKTSNPSSDEFQSLRVDGRDGRSRFLFEEVAHQMSEKYAESQQVGLVVGATDPKSMELARQQAPSLWILCPGVGKQGGDLEHSVWAGRRASDGLGLLINSSRGIAQAPSPRAAIDELHQQIQKAQSSAPAVSPLSIVNLSGRHASGLAPYQVEFFEYCLHYHILEFGSYILKSGRTSPYFFDASKFCDGGALELVGRLYADLLLDHPEVSYDLLYGPAYKGIPLACATATALSRRQIVVPVAFNRKEAKVNQIGKDGKLTTDEEKTMFMGAAVRGKRVILIDDVVTAGTAVKESLELFRKTETALAAILILIDREEVMVTEKGAASSSESATQQIKREYGVPVLSIIGMGAILRYLECMPEMDEHLKQIRAYRDKYGAVQK